MLALSVKNLTKNFITRNFLFQRQNTETKHVLKDCSFEIKQGEIFGLAGLNGIGKTTLIKTILDLQQADSGEISIFGLSHVDVVSRQSVCYLPEKFYPSQYLTGYEFLKLSLFFYKKKLDINEANEMAKKLDLEPNALRQVVKKYSKGMGQKLGLLSCLLSGAKLLILDEPMSGLDPKARVQLKQLLAEYANKGNTIFFSSHIIDDIEEICHKMAVLDDGEIKFIGTPQEFREKFLEASAEKSFLKCIS